MTKRILRVFPKRTVCTPDDELVFIGRPPFRGMIPAHDEVHISCTFTWDKTYCQELKDYWQDGTDKSVLLGGPAFDCPAGDFTPGLYIKHGFTFTSRGCNNNCPWCCVPRIEGKLKELATIHPGNIIQDNNFLQCSRSHKDKVFEMLRGQKGIAFKGGLQASLIDSHFIDGISSLRIAELWVACDTPSALARTVDGIAKLAKAGFPRRKIYCYVIVGKDMNEEEDRMSEIYNAGAIPRAQLLRDFSETKTEYSREWRAFEKMWQRPPATIAHMEKGTSYKDFMTGGKNK